MDKEMYLIEPLSDSMIKAGDALTKELIKTNLTLKASFWFYTAESESWRLIISSPEVASVGPKKIYQRVQKAIRKLSQNSQSSAVALETIAVVEANYPLVALLKIAIKTGPQVNGIRFSKNTINGHYIEDAYIYLMT